LLRDLHLSPLRIDRDNNWLIDPRRIKDDALGAPVLRPPHGFGSGPVFGHATSPTNSFAPDAGSAEPAARGDALRSQIEAMLVAEVAASPRPVAVARLAHLVRQQCPGIESDWLGCGSFKRLLDTLHPPGVAVSWVQLAGQAYDPLRHSLDFLPTNGGDAQDTHTQDPRWPTVQPLLQVASFPAMSGHRYRTLLEALATALKEGPYALSTTSKRVRDLCLDQRVAIARSDINSFLRALLFNGFDPQAKTPTWEDLVATTCGVALAACEREGVAIDDHSRATLLSWMTSEAPER